jgi:purine nucleoside phosphorylase
MILPPWISSETVRDYMLMLEGIERRSVIHDLVREGDFESKLMLSELSLADGSDPRDVVAPIVTAHSNGIRGLFVIAPVWSTSSDPFDWFCITDHVNLSGENPLRGGPLVEGRPWFTSMGDAYARGTEEWLEHEMGEQGVVMSGVLAGLSGPTHPTTAEKTVLAAWGCAAYSWHIFTASIAAAHLGMPFRAVGWNGDREDALHKLLHPSS